MNDSVLTSVLLPIALATIMLGLGLTLTLARPTAQRAGSSA
ncbi:hypothetical protein AB0E63_02720 [Kribbella sp. NPDC026596]